jgi:hypothetical protein
VNAVTIGANCHWVAAALQLNGGNMASPSTKESLPPCYDPS